MEGIELIVSLQQVQNHQENLLVSSDGDCGFSAVSDQQVASQPSSVCIRLGHLESTLSDYLSLFAELFEALIAAVAG